MGTSIKLREKHERIRKLRCFQQVHEMLAHGYPAPAVAKFIVEQGEARDMTSGSLNEALKRYRRDLLPGDIMTHRMPHVIIEAGKQYSDKLEELKRMDVMFEALLYRFDMAHADERISGRLDPQVDKIAKSINDCVRTMHSIKMDLGISGQRMLGTLTVSAERLEEIRQKHGDKAAKAMADPVSRARVLAAMDMIRKAALKRAEEAGEVIEVESVPVDGEES